ncbi:MAG TPA: hypothetical protein VF607_16550 [Verrucomicrobiae bacterium]
MSSAQPATFQGLLHEKENSFPIESFQVVQCDNEAPTPFEGGGSGGEKNFETGSRNQGDPEGGGGDRSCINLPSSSGPEKEN